MKTFRRIIPAGVVVMSVGLAGLLAGCGGQDIGYGVAVDILGHAYITGYTTSLDFLGCNSDTAFGDAFVVKIAE